MSTPVSIACNDSIIMMQICICVYAHRCACTCVYVYVYAHVYMSMCMFRPIFHINSMHIRHAKIHKYAHILLQWCI